MGDEDEAPIEYTTTSAAHGCESFCRFSTRSPSLTLLATPGSTCPPSSASGQGASGQLRRVDSYSRSRRPRRRERPVVEAVGGRLVERGRTIAPEQEHPPRRGQKLARGLGIPSRPGQPKRLVIVVSQDVRKVLGTLAGLHLAPCRSSPVLPRADGPRMWP